MAKKNAKKSVSFTSSKTPQSPSMKELKTDAIVHPSSPEEEDQEDQESLENQDIAIFRFNLKAAPLAIFSMGVLLFYQDFTTRDNVLAYLTKQNLILTCFQLIYTPIFISSLVEKRKNKHNKNVKFQFGKDWPLLFFALIIGSFAIIPVYILLVLFGAPFNFKYFKENSLASWQIVNLTLPLIVTYLKLGKLSKELVIKLTFVIFLGCWCGAVVVPLDWDRPWQTWPLPIVFGSYLGGLAAYIVGSFMV